MKDRTFRFSHLAIAALAALPAVAIAAIPATAPYNTDRTNAYVQDQTSDIMANLNNILCYVGAMDPAEMVGQGPYIALVDKTICEPNSGGGRSGSNNTGANYEPAIVDVSRASTSAPMIAKVWIDQPANAQTINAYLSATQAPSATDPYGRFRMDFCGKSAAGTCNDLGFINSTNTGLQFFSSWTGNTGMGVGTANRSLLLNASSTTAGSGAISETMTIGGVGATTTFTFAYDANYFSRSDGVNPAQCFDRNPANAAESVWSYGLYDSTTGARIERNSGFPIEYTDLATQTVMNGYVGYWGLWTPTTADTTKPVNQITYGATSATKTAYTLLQTGGKLTKFTKQTKTLAQLDKVKFQFWPNANVPGVVIPSTPASLSMGTGYEVYWDQAGNTFQISGQQDPTTWNMVPFATPVALSIANMKLAAPWGIYGWSQMLGGSYTVPGTAIATLGSATTITYYTQDIVYPSDFAALNGMLCLRDCPTAADITLSNAATAMAPVSPFAAATTTWVGAVPGRAMYTYTLNGTTGNLVDAAAGVVVSTATTGNNAWGIQSGRLVAGADLATLDAAVTARAGTAGQYIESDIDAVPSFYQWQTGPNNWDQLSILTAANGTPVKFDPPINVDWTVPATGAQYGTLVGATVTLQYGGFGDLWGIPSTCIDIATNAACTFGVGGTANNNQRWTPQFSIPAGASVTVNVTQGTVTAGTTYLVKALEKEVRLANVALATCTGAGLTLPAAATVTPNLPTQTSWVDPSVSTSSTYVGAKPTFATKPAPRVVHGVKKF